MREIEVTKMPELDERQRRLADLHSLLNVLNVISLQIGQLALENSSSEKDLFLLESEVGLIGPALQSDHGLHSASAKIKHVETKLAESMKELTEHAESEVQLIGLSDTGMTLDGMFKILKLQYQEYVLRREDPNSWLTTSVDLLNNEIHFLFEMIERNARGRYHIEFRPEDKAPEDYLVNLKIDSELPDQQIIVPISFKDVLRDLMANARKYTRPGGEISLHLSQDSESITCCVEDNGMGIPDHEVLRVTEFGYRGTNARQVRSLGGGFGLTKAARIVIGLGGQFFIASEENRGTRIRLKIPSKTAA